MSAQEPTTAPPIDGRAGPFRYSYHFDHNALKDCLRISDVLIALTDSGNLLRFDAATLKMTGQEVVRGRGTAVAVGADGHVLVGTLAGRVWKVDPATLAAESLFETPGGVVWLGSRPGMIVAAVHGDVEPWPWPGETDKHFMARWRRLEIERGKGLSVVVSQDGRRRVLPLERTEIFTPGSFLLDGQTRLWMGTDKGEWGGEYAELALRSGKIRTVKTDLGVLGFLRAADGRVLAYGGMSHMWSDNGFIGRVDRGHLENLRQFAKRPEWAAAPPAVAKILRSRSAGEPEGPIDFVLEDGYAAFWVLSANALYHANGDFSQWTKVRDLRGRWVGGRAYSVGSTPTVRSLVAGARAAELITVTGLDGLARIGNDKVEPFAFEGEIEAPIIEAWNSPIGTVLVMADSLHAAWRLKDGRWQRLEFCAAHDGMSWYDAGPLGADSNGIIGFCAEGSAPGMRDLTRVRADGTTEVLRTWKEPNGYLEHWFLEKPGGRLFRSLGGELEEWDGKAWQRAGHFVEPSPSDTKSIFYGRRFVALGQAARGALYLDAQWGELARLADGPEDVEFAPLAGAFAHGLKNIFDLAPDQDGWVLVAAVKGLFRFRPEGGDIERIPGPKTNEELKSLCRDAQGRLWAAGDGLYVSADEGQHWEAADLPMLGLTYTKRVRANPADARGVVLALYDRGVVFVGRDD